MPLLSVLVLAFRSSPPNFFDAKVKTLGVWTAGFCFCLACALVYQLSCSASWAAGISSQHYVLSFFGYQCRFILDGLSLTFILLNNLLTFCVLVAIGPHFKKGMAGYVISFLLLSSFSIGVFCSFNLLVFFIFFELLLLPMFFLVGIWGGPNRLYAAFKFFVYTFSGSLLMLVALVYIYAQVGSFDLERVMQHGFSHQEQVWLCLAFLVAFAIKIPMFPVHTWLPDTHVEAPTGGSVILAGIMLKLGGYGLLRFVLPLFPAGVFVLRPAVFILSVIAIVYASIVAFGQRDIKKLVAYSSVAHMGIVTLGLFLMTEEAAQGAVFQMISHGLVSGGLFFAIGVVYERLHTRDREEFGGIALSMPVYAACFMVLTLGSLGLPGTSGFVGEVLVVLSLFKYSPVLSVVAATGAFWSAMYSLWLYRKVVFGMPSSQKILGLPDLFWREKCVLASLAFLVVLFGVWPRPIFFLTQNSVRYILGQPTGRHHISDHAFGGAKAVRR